MNNPWYETLIKPELTPPSWVFGPAWTILYILILISLIIIWRSGIWRREVKVAIYIFFVQIVLNIIWSPLFFTLQSPFLAFIDIMMLWAAIIFTIFNFFKISKTAGWLLIPYILWVSFAMYLNWGIVVGNV